MSGSWWWCLLEFSNFTAIFLLFSLFPPLFMRFSFSLKILHSRKELFISSQYHWPSLTPQSSLLHAGTSGSDTIGYLYFLLLVTAIAAQGFTCDRWYTAIQSAQPDLARLRPPCFAQFHMRWHKQASYSLLNVHHPLHTIPNPIVLNTQLVSRVLLPLPKHQSQPYTVCAYPSLTTLAPFPSQTSKTLCHFHGRRPFVVPDVLVPAQSDSLSCAGACLERKGLYIKTNIHPLPWV